MSKHKKNPPTIAASAPQAVITPASPWWQQYAHWLIAALAIAAYANTLGHGFVLDDPLILEQNKYVTKGFGGIGDLLFKSYRADVADGAATGFLYRPLSPVLFAMEWALGGGKPFLFHLMQVLWYAAACMLLFAALRRLLGHERWLIAAAASVLFALHPIHTEVVANIKSRDEVLALAFGMAALYAWLRHRDEGERKWLIISLISFFLALMSKESAITLLPVFALADWCFRSRTLGQSLKGLAVAAIPVVAFLGLRALVYSGWSGAQQFDVMDNPIIGASGYMERSATGFMVLFKYLQLLVVPAPLLCDYSFNQLPLVGWSNWQAIAGALAYVAAGVWAIRAAFRDRNAVAFFVLAFLASVALYSQLLMVIGTLFGERLMFMPSVWFCGAVALLASRFVSEKGLLTASLAIGAIFFVLTIQRNSAWRDNITLFTTDAAKATQSVRLQNGVGSESYKKWVAEGRNAATLPALITTLKSHSEAAIAIKPNPVSFINIGLAELELKNYVGAETAFNKALELSPNLSIAKQNLIVTYLNWARVEARERQNMPEAIRLFERLVALGHNQVDVLQDLGTCYAINQNPQKAIENYEKCIAQGSTDAGLRKNLAMAYRAVGNVEKAVGLER